LLGLGTYQLTEDETMDAVETALDNGYALIDTAKVYGNEEAIGRVMGNRRRDALVETKVWVYDLGFQRTLDAVQQALVRLDTQFIDVLLIHSPRCESAWADCTQGDKDDDPAHPLWLETWRALEKLYAEGVVLAIGVSNFNAELLQRALTESQSVAPQVIQNYFTLDHLDTDVVKLAKQNGMYYQAYSLIKDGIPEKHLEDLRARLSDLQLEHTPELELLIHWVMVSRIGVLLRSANPDHVVDNIMGPLDDVLMDIDFPPVVKTVDEEPPFFEVRDLRGDAARQDDGRVDGEEEFAEEENFDQEPEFYDEEEALRGEDDDDGGEDGGDDDGDDGGAEEPEEL